MSVLFSTTSQCDSKSPGGLLSNLTCGMGIGTNTTRRSSAAGSEGCRRAPALTGKSDRRHDLAGADDEAIRGRAHVAEWEARD